MWEKLALFGHFWDQPFLLIPIQKRPYFKSLLRKIYLMCRAGEELKRGNGPWRFQILGFQESWGYCDVINGGKIKTLFYST